MSWLSRIWNAKPAKKAPAPNLTARVTVDEPYLLQDMLGAYIGSYAWIAAKYPFQVLDLIDQIYRYEPTLKKHLMTTISLGNPGHEIEIDAPTEAKVQQALIICNDLAARCFPWGGAQDGLINGLLSQAARTGGMCCEWAPDEKKAQIARAYMVPVRSLRFRYDGAKDTALVLGQLQLGQFTPLNPVQVSFTSIYHEDANPYPIPPALAALERLSTHKRIMQSVEQWFQKLAVMGFLTLNFERPEHLGEPYEDYRAKCKTYLDDLSKVVKDNLSSGIVMGFDDMKASFNNTTAGAGGARQIAQMIDEDVFAALARDPVLFGRSFSRTETWSRVAFEELKTEIRNIQLGVKKILEHGHRVNLDLQGFGDCAVRIEFKDFGSLDNFRDSEADKMKSDKVFAAFDRQLIDNVKALRLLGFADEGAGSGAFVASFDNGRYVMKPHERSSYPVGRPVAAEHERVMTLSSSKKRMVATGHPTQEMGIAIPGFGTVFNSGPAETQSAARQYLAEIRGMLGEAGSIGVDAVYDWALTHDVPFVEEFVAEAMRLYREAAESAIEEARLIEIARTHISTIWETAKADPALWGPAFPRQAGIGKLFDLPDRKAISYMSEKVDKMYVSQYVSNSPQRSKQIQNFLQNQYLEKGLGIGKSKKELATFKAEFGDISQNLTDHAARIIVDTGVQRARNWSSIYALSEEGFAEFEIMGPMDRLTCKYCKAMNHRKFSVATERQRIENIIENGEEDISKFDPFITSRYGTKGGLESLKTSSDESVQKSGMVTPPFHPLCRHRIVAVV